MQFSRFGQKFTRQSGILQLMDDLGRALSEGKPVNMLGGGNPAHIPAVQQAFADTLRQIADAFAERRFNGDRDTWPEKIPDPLWQQVTNDRHGCLKNACPNRAECPFYLARDTLETVDVVVANHDLLLSDIAMGGGVILPAPENSFYCIDEAHHLAKKAVSRFAAEHSLNQALWMLDKLPPVLDRVVGLTDKNETGSLADEAAASLLDSLNEWQFHLNGEPAATKTRTAP